MLTRLPLAAILALLVLAALALPAQAETITLRGGKTLEAERVTFEDDAVVAVLHRDGGVARVRLRFDKLETASILALYDRTHDPKDAGAVLAGAALAARLDLREAAYKRFREAARLAPALAAARDSGIAALRALEAGDAFEALERQVRSGHDARGAVVQAHALLDGPNADVLTPARTRRIQALARLARAMVARDEARAATPKPALPIAPGQGPVAAKPAAKAQGKKPAPPKPTGALGIVQGRVDAYVARADFSREAAADPAASARQALRHLQKAADAYQLARRLVREAPAQLASDLAEVGDDVRLALVTTYLEIADLYRQERHFDAARARVRAALILDPGNEEAWTQRRLIEDDLSRPITPSSEAYEPAVQFFRISPSPFWSPYATSRPYLRRLYPYGRHHGSGHHGSGFYASGGHFGFWTGGAHQRGHGTTRVVGRRR